MGASPAADWGLKAAQAMLGRMLDSADDVLFELSGRTLSEDERRGYFDAMRLLRKCGADLACSFELALRPAAKASSSAPLVFSAKTLSLRGDDEVDNEIIVARSVSRIEAAVQELLWEFGLRLENAPREGELRARLELLRPKSLVDAFHLAQQPLQLTPEIRLILFKLFERQLLADAPPYYESLNNRLESEGISSDAVPVRRGANATAGTRTPAAVAPPSYSVPSSLVSSLSQWGVPGSAWSATAESAASAFTGGAPQRVSLVNQLLEETGARWPREDLEALRRLILPIVQIALSDASFFTHHEHPARQLIAGLEVLATEPVAARGPRLAQTEDALRRLQQQQPAPATIAPLTGDDLGRFLSSQRSPRTSTSARMTSARVAAHEQIKTLGSGYDLPLGLGPFLNEIWMPMVSAMSLRFGVGSNEWKRSSEVLQHLFGECRWLTGGNETGMVDTILDDVSTEMQQMGMPPNLVERGAALLRSGLANDTQNSRLLDLDTFGVRAGGATRNGPATRPAAERAGGSQMDWRAALPVGAWFRVFDRQSDRTLWMAADVFYPESPQLSFIGFDSEVRLAVPKPAFLDDLRCGKAEAVNPSQAQAEAIAHLLAEHRTAA